MLTEAPLLGTKKLRCRLACVRWTLSHSWLVNAPNSGCLARFGSVCRRAMAPRSSDRPSSVDVGGGRSDLPLFDGNLTPAGMGIDNNFLRKTFANRRKCRGNIMLKPSIELL